MRAMVGARNNSPSVISTRSSVRSVRSFQMSAWLRNERLEFCLAVIIGVTIGSSPVIIMPILESLLPGVVLWPVAWLVFLACNCVALIVWWFTRRPAAGEEVRCLVTSLVLRPGIVECAHRSPLAGRAAITIAPRSRADVHGYDG